MTQMAKFVFKLEFFAKLIILGSHQFVKWINRARYTRFELRVPLPGEVCCDEVRHSRQGMRGPGRVCHRQGRRILPLLGTAMMHYQARRAVPAAGHRRYIIHSTKRQPANFVEASYIS